MAIAERLLNIFPGDVINNGPNGAFTHSIFFRQLSIIRVSMALANLADTLIRQARSVASACILRTGDRLQVIRVDASTISAQMVKLQAYWYRTFYHLIYTTVGVGPSAQAVSTRSNVSIPIPASADTIHSVCDGVFPSMVPVNVSVMMATVLTGSRLRLCNEPHRIATSTHTQSGGIRVRERGARRTTRSRAEPSCLKFRRMHPKCFAASFTDTIRGTINGLHGVSPNQTSCGVAPRVVPATPGLSRASIIPEIRAVTGF